MKFYAHQYLGKENGLMLLSDRDGIHQLIAALQSGIDAPGFNGSIAAIDIGKGSEYRLSFHLKDIADEVTPNMPHSSSVSAWFLWLLPFTLIGFINTVHSFLQYL